MLETSLQLIRHTPLAGVLGECVCRQKASAATTKALHRLALPFIRAAIHRRCCSSALQRALNDAFGVSPATAQQHPVWGWGLSSPPWHRNSTWETAAGPVLLCTVEPGGGRKGREITGVKQEP